jgi:signal transduction histidine kinase/HAMP domain-containing protein
MSFRLKTVLGIALIEIVMLSILLFSGLQYLTSTNEGQLLERARTTARLVAAMVGDSVVALDLATLDVLVEQTLEKSDIVYSRVLNQNGTVLAEGGNPQALSATFKADSSIQNTLDDGRLDVFAVIEVADTEFGRVELGIATATLSKSINKAKNWMTTIALVEIVVVGLFGLMLGQILLRNLRDLRVSASRVADGDFGFQLEVCGSDELADTARSFNRMSRELAKFAEGIQTELYTAETDLDQTKRLLDEAVGNVSVGIMICDDQDVLLMMNDSAHEMLGVDENHLPIGSSKSQVEHVLSACTATMEEWEIEGGEDRQQALHHFSNGQAILVTRQILASGGEFAVLSDVTTLLSAQSRALQLEKELHQAQKLEAVGQLAGGIAHEINTPSQYIGDNLRFLTDAHEDLFGLLNKSLTLADAAREKPDLMQMTAEVDALCEELDLEYLKQEIPSATEQSLSGISQVSRIVLAMKEFSHPGNREMSLSDINSALENTITISRGEWRHVAEMTTSFNEALPAVMCLPGEVNQVFLNLIVNAAHAIAEKQNGEGLGTISVLTEPSGEDVIIKVSDTGNGIPTDVRDQIFNPFFTTKEVGQGTGQGLSIARDIIVNKHGGNISFESQAGEGTTFTIRLPVRAKTPQVVPASSAGIEIAGTDQQDQGQRKEEV